mmetsp:Transcript_27611/g.40771  ORF Transcript_27611/g.40771 Transcript_27611/m.40771 type:complete len:193 (-) Transcript_27611:108-686(-)
MAPLSAIIVTIALVAACLRGVSSFCIAPLSRPLSSQFHEFPGYQGAAERKASRPLHASVDDETYPTEQQSPILIDLQTFVKLCGLVMTGGEAKAAIQSGKVRLNFDIETRRAKKLFAGDEVSFGETTLDVSDEVNARGYVYKVKKKKEKPAAKVLEDGSLEFGGRYRSEEWRAERKQKKAERKEAKQMGGQE